MKNQIFLKYKLESIFGACAIVGAFFVHPFISFWAALSVYVPIKLVLKLSKSTKLNKAISKFDNKLGNWLKKTDKIYSKKLKGWDKKLQSKGAQEKLSKVGGLTSGGIKIAKYAIIGLVIFFILKTCTGSESLTTQQKNILETKGSCLHLLNRALDIGYLRKSDLKALEQKINMELNTSSVLKGLSDDTIMRKLQDGAAYQKSKNFTNAEVNAGVTMCSMMYQ